MTGVLLSGLRVEDGYGQRVAVRPIQVRRATVRQSSYGEPTVRRSDPRSMRREGLVSSRPLEQRPSATTRTAATADPANGNRAQRRLPERRAANGGPPSGSRRARQPDGYGQAPGNGSSRRRLTRARRPPDLAGTAAPGTVGSRSRTARTAPGPAARTAPAAGPSRRARLGRRDAATGWYGAPNFLPEHPALWRAPATAPGLRRFGRLRFLGPLGPARLLQPGRQRARPRR